MTRRIMLLVLAVGLVSGCSTDEASLQLGIKRVALSLAFADEEKAEPVAPRVVYQMVPAPPALVAASPDVVPTNLPSFELPAFVSCPKAPEGGVPEQAVLRVATRSPAGGQYPRRNTGTVHIEGGVIPIDLPYPPFSIWEHSEPTPVVIPGDPTGAVPPTEGDEYTVKKSLTPDFFVIETFRRTPTEIQLLKRETSANGTTTVFTPSPPVTYYLFGVENDEWRSAAMDTETSTAMLLTGKIVKREVVDVCGTLVDTYQAQITEELVNLDTGEVSGSDPAEPSLLSVAPHLGGIIVKEDIHSTTRTRDPESGAPISITFDYVSTASTTEPVPPGFL